MRDIAVLPGEHNLTDYAARRLDFDFAQAQADFTWHETGRVNIVFEAVDRHVAQGRGDNKALFFWDGNREESHTFSSLKEESCRLARALRGLGVAKGDRVAVFLPRCPELYVTFLGAARIGAVVVPLFEAFMEDALGDRLHDSGAKVLVTAPGLADRVPGGLPDLKIKIMVDKSGGALPQGYLSWHSEVCGVSADDIIVWVEGEDPLFILFASGADGRPRGLVHVHNTMVGLAVTARWVHDLKPGDTYWCTADPGWITGIAYGFLAPWLLGIPVVVRGGRFDAQGWCETLERYGVSVWYSAPTAFRMIMAAGGELEERYDLSNLRHVLSVGEPLTPEVLEWSLGKLGLPIYDTWWMSETGMNIVCSLRCLPVRHGSIGKPVPGVEVAVIDDEGRQLPPGKIGNLAVKKGWPSMFRGVWNNPGMYSQYFRLDPWFISGDSAHRDQDGYFYFHGRVDGVINTSGERVGPGEVEKKLEEHPAVSRAAVAGKPDKLRGEIVKAFINLNPGFHWSDELAGELRQLVKKGLAAHAAPREFEVRENIPLDGQGGVDRRAVKEWILGLGQPGGDTAI